jgi:hypothetical protein
VLEPGIEFARELCTVRQHLEDALVYELVKQYWKCGNLPGQEIAMPAHLDQPLERRRILVEQ